MGKGLIVAAMLVPAGLLAACTATGDQSAAPMAHTAAVSPAAAPGGVIRHGDSFALMSAQYGPRGAHTATGASAWVPAAPPPAFVATGPAPPADPPAPPLAAVANRQPVPATPASELVRPEAAQPAPAPAPAAPARSPAVRTAGLALFNANACSACHMFEDAGAMGNVGPSLDGGISAATVVAAVTEGRGPMPSFRGSLSEAEIQTLANYISQYSKR